MNLKLTISLWFAYLMAAFNLNAQTSGCTDMQASNYNADATVNDASCIYPVTHYAPTLIAHLNDSIAETSGLINDGNFLWTINDSGNEPFIYKINKTDGTIQNKVYISNASNIDWEALTQNEAHIFIGDFGNNNGNRTNLRILKISKSDIESNDSVEATFINFHYPEQTSFESTSNYTYYDCEAMIYTNDSLYLFTKDWITESTQLYALPSEPGTFPAKLHTAFHTNGLITDASFHKDSATIVLLGYRRVTGGMFVSFAWILSDFSDVQFFSGNKRRIELGNILGIGQNEGIGLLDAYQGFITGEALNVSGFTQDAKLSKFDFSSYFQNATSSVPLFSFSETIIYPNPANTKLNLTLDQWDKKPFVIYDLYGVVILKGNVLEQQIAIETLNSGNYILLIDGQYSAKFIKR